MSARHSLPVVIVILSFVPASLLGQETQEAEPDPSPAVIAGEQVRVTTGSIAAPFVGLFSSWDADALEITSDSLTTYTIPLAEVVKLEIYRGEKKQTLVGALVGAAAGIVTGVLIANSTQSAEPGWFSEVEEGASDAGYVLLSTAVGVTVGGFIGSRIRTEKWEEVPVPEYAP